MQNIDFQHTSVSKIIKDYLAKKNSLSPFYHRFPAESNFLAQAKDKLQNFKHREILNQTLDRQHNSLKLSEKQQVNLKLLQQNNSVTVTTGHQLNLLTGPLYFIYKILHTIKICDELNSSQTEIKYVPIYWMATEDHDFQEINHFKTYHKTYQYDAENGGYVGEINSENAENVLTEFLTDLDENLFKKELQEILYSAYFQKLSLAEATRKIVHEFLGKFGILILDANDAGLKKCMIPYFEKELFESASLDAVQDTNEKLNQYKNQAFAREINLFYLHNNRRERIERTSNGFILVDSGTEFTKDEIKNELHDHTEKFSPNVILRPLYQEVILPNTGYVGGGGEIAYWLQLKRLFEENDVFFPILIVRNSVLLIPARIKHLAEKFDFLSEQMFRPQFEIKNEFTQKQSELFAELQDLKDDLALKFSDLEKIAEKTTPVFKKMVDAQKAKQLNGFDKMHKRLLKSEKLRFNTQINQLDTVYNYFFPNGNWQEREINISEFYPVMGPDIFQLIYNKIPAFESTFILIDLDC